MKYIMMVCVAVCMLVGCKPAAKTSDFDSVDAETFKTYVMGGDVQLLDVRTPEEYAVSHIEGALNLNVMDASFATAVDSLDKNEPVYVYCRSGRRSKKAADVLVGKGYKVLELASGFNGWTQAGYAVK